MVMAAILPAELMVSLGNMDQVTDNIPKPKKASRGTIKDQLI